MTSSHAPIKVRKHKVHAHHWVVPVLGEDMACVREDGGREMRGKCKHCKETKLFVVSRDYFDWSEMRMREGQG